MAESVSSSTDSLEAVNAANGVLAEKVVVDEQKSVPESEKDSGETTEVSEATEADLEETQDVESTSTDDDADEELEAKEGDEAPKKKNGGFKKRIDKLTSKLSKKDQEIDFWKQEALRAKTNQPKTDEVLPEKKTEPTGKPKADDFKTHEEWIEALADWKLEAREKEKEQKAKEIQVKTDFQKRNDSFQSRINEFKKTAHDFEELMDESPNVPRHIAEELVDSEIGPALMYELAKNPTIIEKMHSVGVGAGLLELEKLKEKIAKISTPATSKETKTTKAPAPVSPIGNKGATVRKSLSDPNLSQKEYERLREEQLKAARMA